MKNIHPKSVSYGYGIFDAEKGHYSVKLLPYTARLRLIQYRHRMQMVRGYVEIASLCSMLERPADAVFFKLTAQVILDKVEADEDILEFLYLHRALV